MKIIKDLKILARSYFVLLFVFLIHRIIFWSVFKDSLVSKDLMLDWTSITKAWWIGFRFDVRVITLFLLFGLLLFFVIRMVLKPIPRTSGFYRKFQIMYLASGLLLFTTVYWVDLGNYSYLEERLTSKIFALLSSPDIALGMVAQSYPMYLIIPGLLLVVWIFLYLTFRLIFAGDRSSVFFGFEQKYGLKDGFAAFGVFLLMAVLIHSKFSQYPLRWSEAYFSKNHFINQFALNPMQNISDTYKFSKSSYTLNDIKPELSLIKKELGLSNDSNDFLVRMQQPNPIDELKDIKNVVVIMMESLAAYKIGTYGGPLNTTPNFDELAKESLLFENFHVVQTGTASSIFCFITGTPDLNEEETASRNPLVVDQHTMINNFMKHDKYYLIGGDANWGNIRGVIKNNINDLKLMEEKDFKTASKTDIWGISDLELFKQAHAIFTKNQKPFFSFIQTAGYHRPYTIPKIRDGFEIKDITEKQIKDFGFAGEDEFNSLRFSDHALGEFFKMAKKSKYYKDTLFVVYADHGLRSYDQIQLSSFYKTHFFPVYHIPFLIHSPKLPHSLKGFKDPTLGYESDMLPTIQAMLGVEGPNSSFGLDLRSEEAKKRTGLFLRGSGALPVRFFDGERMISSGLEENSEIKSFKTEKFIEQLHAIKEDTYLNQEEEITDDIKKKANIGKAYLKVIKFKLKNNQKSKVKI